MEALEIIEKDSPGIVLLDIEMPEMNGMDLIQCLGSHEFKLIFQTAYSEFAVEAFEKNAIDYILKPFDRKRFDQAIDKALGQRPHTMSQIHGLSHQFAKDEDFSSKGHCQTWIKKLYHPH